MWGASKLEGPQAHAIDLASVRVWASHEGGVRIEGLEPRGIYYSTTIDDVDFDLARFVAELAELAGPEGIHGSHTSNTQPINQDQRY
jgi:hypothetical protein